MPYVKAKITKYPDYNIAELKNFYRNSFARVKYFIAPDYSLCGDINKIENLHRLFKARIVSVWLTLELNAVVIPNITYSNEKIFPYMLDGMENCEVVAISKKGLRNSCKKLSLMKKALKHTVDNLKKLRTIIIYTLSKDVEKIRSWFDYATRHDKKRTGDLTWNDTTIRAWGTARAAVLKALSNKMSMITQLIT